MARTRQPGKNTAAARATSHDPEVLRACQRADKNGPARPAKLQAYSTPERVASDTAYALRHLAAEIKCLPTSCLFTSSPGRRQAPFVVPQFLRFAGPPHAPATTALSPPAPVAPPAHLGLHGSGCRVRLRSRVLPKTSAPPRPVSYTHLTLPTKRIV